jgi:hypothetical protein
MARLFDAQRMVLRTVEDLPKDAAGYVTDTQIAQRSSVSLTRKEKNPALIQVKHDLRD